MTLAPFATLSRVASSCTVRLSATRCLWLLPFFSLASYAAAEGTSAQSADREPTAETAAAHRAQAASASPAPAAPASDDAAFPRSLGFTFDRELLRDLPLSDGLWSIFETVESTAILDRMDSGGLYVGEAGLLGIRGSSWTQASWLLGDLDITDPDRTGTPLFFADADSLEAVDIAAGLTPADQRGIGPGISLVVRRPGPTWQKSLQFNQAPSGLQQSRTASIARLDSFVSGHFRLDGPLIKDRLGLLVSGTLARGSRLERSDPRPLDGRQLGFLTHLIYTPNARDEIRVLAGYQGVTHPYAGRARLGGGDIDQSDRFFHVQSTWQERGVTRPWSLTAGFVRGTFDPHLPNVPTGVVERTLDGPLQQQFPGVSTRSRFAMSGFVDVSTRAHHALRVGASVALAHSTTRPAGSPELTGETVDGLPARVWDYGWAGAVSKWRGFDVAAYGTDQIRYGRLSVDAGVRYEASRARAAGSPGEIEWLGLSSRFVARLRPFGGEGLTLLSGYAWYHSRLPLSLLAYGDPAAAQGLVYRWRDRNGNGLFDDGERRALVARVGPGGSFVSIDPHLKPPRSRDVFVGLETQAGHWKFRFLAYHRRERDLVTSVNVGAPVSAYDVSFIPDPANDIVGSADDQLLPVYNRRPETFGQDRYVLTNDPEKGKDKGLEILIERQVGKRLRVLAGATASKTLSPAAYRGFRATENDQGVVGERLELPNATTLSKGRTFFERGYNLKFATTYHAPHDIRIGVVGRYQDGQHFARLVIPTDLNQGAEPIRGITNGESRFTFVLTFDGRLEKGFSLGGASRLAAILEVFNLGGSSIEVEEDVIWGPSYRATTAVQPPRGVRLGLRLDF